MEEYEYELSNYRFILDGKIKKARNKELEKDLPPLKYSYKNTQYFLTEYDPFKRIAHYSSRGHCPEHVMRRLLARDI